MPSRNRPPKGLIDSFDKLNFRQELFCQYYVKNAEFRGNATHSYAAAYNYNLEACSHDDAVYEQVLNDKGDVVENKLVRNCTFKRVETMCSTSGHRLLRNARIQDRLIELGNAMLRDDVIDNELSKLIMQNEDKGAKNTAIREYNKMKGRIIDKKMLTDAEGKALPIIGLVIHEPAADE